MKHLSIKLKDLIDSNGEWNQIEIIKKKTNVYTKKYNLLYLYRKYCEGNKNQ